MEISKKQSQLYQDIISQEKPKISVLGSAQSGKTFIISLATIKYAIELSKYDNSKTYYGAIVGWSVDTLKRNICNVMEGFLNQMGLKKKRNSFDNNYDYDIQWGTSKYIQINNIVFYFFGFNTAKSFNKILGDPLIYVWIDESARIYSSSQLQESFDEFPGRQLSYVSNPYRKVIHSFNVEGNENHPYKIKYIDNFDGIKYVFYPYDNPVLDTKEKIKEAVKSFPKGSLREQKVFNKWVVADGKVFNTIPLLCEEELKEKYIIREIGIGCDYGSVNPTTFCPVALAQNIDTRLWCLVLLGDKYYHDPKTEGDTPTTEFYSSQLRMYIDYLHKKYKNIPVNTLVIDSEASHFDNRLTVDNIRHELAKKNKISVDESVQFMQSLFYKDYLKVIEAPNIRYFMNNGEPIFTGYDVGLDELRSYHYDKLRSEKEGINSYVKDYDHYIDGSRYIIMEFQLTGRAPVV